ncbi:porin [Pelovirga terrestris]|uniref:Porin n=1 Tax=Pelovirga terrestris TaxID=2771352 RepID=A0A8J6QSU1_9BACT|nr:porin [Pelovirga terrestris]MBD1401140.1 porin [Pelovirga terrestris]
MSRLVSLLIVLLTIAVATPVLAEDRLSLSGYMRVRGYYIDNTNFDKNSNDSSESYFDQRLRILGKIAVADGVSVHFRQNFSNGKWETSSTETRPLAWLNVDKGMFNLKAGKMYYGIGNAIAIDTLGTGFVATMNGAIPVEFGYFKLEENNASKDDDVDLYTLAVKHGTDLYNAVVFGGFLRDGGTSGSNDGSKKYVAGVQTNFNLDPVSVNFELNYFTGEDDNNNLNTGTKEKYRGLQLFTDVGTALSEQISAGLVLAYAKGYDDKTQVTSFTDDGSFLPETYGFFETDYDSWADSDNAIFRIAEDGDRNAGSRAVQGYVHARIIDALSVRAMVGYAKPDEKGESNFKSMTYGVASANYQLAANTNLRGVYGYYKPKARVAAQEDDAKQVLAFNLIVRF